MSECIMESDWKHKGVCLDVEYFGEVEDFGWVWESCIDAGDLL